MENQRINTQKLRKMSSAIYIALEENIAKDISEALKESADEIDTLRSALKETCQRLAGESIPSPERITNLIVD